MSGVLPSPAFWQNRSVLVTGHTGFKGTWLCLWLTKMGAKVTGYSKDVPTRPSLFEDLELASIIDDRRGDVCDLARVSAIVNDVRPSIILHLAAQALVRPSYQNPVETYATNVMGTVHVLEAARHAPDVGLVLTVTSDKCYDNKEWVWRYRENDPMGGADPYSNSKGCAELVASAYARSFTKPSQGLQIVSARAGNVIGGGDWAVDRLIPDLVRGLATGNPVQIRSPSAVRPWQHVLDPLSGYLVLCEHAFNDRSIGGEGWNFGPNADNEVTVREIADTVCRLWGNPDGWQDVSAQAKPHEAQFLRLDCAKANSELKWRARWDLAAALSATVDVYKSNLKGSALRTLLLDQIGHYTSSSKQAS